MKHIENKIKKTKIYPLYLALPNDNIRRNVLERYAKLMQNATLFPKAIQGHSAKSIYPCIALYKACIAAGYEPREVLLRIKKTILEQGAVSAKYLRFVSNFPFFFHIFKGLCKLSTKTSYATPWFNMRWKNTDAHSIKWDCYKCFYKDEFSKHGAPELTSIFCQLDDIVYGNMKNILWKRTQNLGQGNTLCDFHFVKIKYKNFVKK